MFPHIDIKSVIGPQKEKGVKAKITIKIPSAITGKPGSCKLFWEGNRKALTFMCMKAVNPASKPKQLRSNAKTTSEYSLHSPPDQFFNKI